MSSINDKKFDIESIFYEINNRIKFFKLYSIKCPELKSQLHQWKDDECKKCHITKLIIIDHDQNYYDKYKHLMDKKLIQLKIKENEKFIPPIYEILSFKYDNIIEFSRAIDINYKKFDGLADISIISNLATTIFTDINMLKIDPDSMKDIYPSIPLISTTKNTFDLNFIQKIIDNANASIKLKTNNILDLICKFILSITKDKASIKMLYSRLMKIIEVNEKPQLLSAIMNVKKPLLSSLDSELDSDDDENDANDNIDNVEVDKTDVDPEDNIFDSEIEELEEYTGMDTE
jgi:hypothetical protein